MLNQFDTNSRITHRLYRQHCQQRGYSLVKDIGKIGRPLDRTIIIDNVAENFALQPNNGIFIKTWYNDMDDDFLLDLVPLLRGTDALRPSGLLSAL